MTKKAVLVGCNYPGTKAELKGCVNDVWRMKRSLVERFGFAEEDIQVLIDVEAEEEGGGGGRYSSYAAPTGANIREAMHRLVASASGPGDVLFFHYSGHGTRLPANQSDSDDLTGYDECIVPCDMNLITDEDFREMVDKLPKGASLTVVSDSCHSGGLIEHEKEQIGDSFQVGGGGAEEEGGGGGQRDYYGGEEEEEERGGGWQGWLKKGVKKVLESEEVREAIGEWGGGGRTAAAAGGVEVKNKALSFETLVELLKDKSGREDIEEGNVRTSLLDIFGDDASSKVKRIVGLVLGGSNNDNNNSWVGSLASQLLTQQLQGFGGGGSGGDEEEVADAGGGGRYNNVSQNYSSTSSKSSDRGVLVSGCQTDQTSADANPGNGDAYGALSNAIQTVLAAAEPGQTLTNRHLVKEVRKLLASQGFTQQPGLYCTDESAEAPFICSLE